MICNSLSDEFLTELAAAAGAADAAGCRHGAASVPSHGPWSPVIDCQWARVYDSDRRTIRSGGEFTVP